MLIQKDIWSKSVRNLLLQLLSKEIAMFKNEISSKYY